EQGQHHAAHLAGRADHTDDGPVGRVSRGAAHVDLGRRGGRGALGGVPRPVPPSTTASVCSASRPNAEWITRTASSSFACSVTTEMRISEVEIMSMLMPASPSERNSVAETPGGERTPAPTMLTLPVWSV